MKSLCNQEYCDECNELLSNLKRISENETKYQERINFAIKIEKNSQIFSIHTILSGMYDTIIAGRELIEWEIFLWTTEKMIEDKRSESQ